MDDLEFPCTSCGCCCSHVNMAVENAKNSPHPVWKKSGETFPYSYDSTGKCEKLIDNKCSVYDDRPLLCNVNKLGELLGFNVKDWHLMVAKSCNELMIQDKISEEYKIKIEDII